MTQNNTALDQAFEELANDKDEAVSDPIEITEKEAQTYVLLDTFNKWFLEQDRETRMKTITTLAHNDKELRYEAKNKVPKPKSRYVLAKTHGPLTEGQTVTVIASGEGCGGTSYCICQNEDNVIRMIPVKELTNDNKVA